MSSKLLRSELKEIVKECLVEILSEGLDRRSSRVNKASMSSVDNSTRIPKRKSHLDNIVYNKESIQEKKQIIKNKVMNSNITTSPILNELLADTAASTLQEQNAAEGRKGATPVSVGGDAAAKMVDNSDPTDLFGNSSNKWAALAFS